MVSSSPADIDDDADLWPRLVLRSLLLFRGATFFFQSFPLLGYCFRNERAMGRVSPNLVAEVFQGYLPSRRVSQKEDVTKAQRLLSHSHEGRHVIQKYYKDEHY